MMIKEIDIEMENTFLSETWPELEGTEKQVQWAQKIRSKLMTTVYRCVVSMQYENHFAESFLIGIVVLAKRYIKNTSAKFWIENRDLTAKLDYCRMVCKYDDYIKFFKLDGGMSRYEARRDDEKREKLEAAAKGFDGEDLSYVVEKLIYGEQPVIGVTAITAEEREIASAIDAERAARCTLSPVNPASVLPFKIRVTESREFDMNVPVYYHTVSVITPERQDEVRELVKKLGFGYSNGAWSNIYRQPCEYERDRILEIAATIFKVGYIVELPYEDMVNCVITGQYRPYNPRRLNVHNGKFAFKWGPGEHFSDSNALRKLLPKASWSRDIMALLIPPEAYASVLEIAKQYNFEICAESAALANEYDLRRKAVQLYDGIIEPEPQEAERGAGRQNTEAPAGCSEDRAGAAGQGIERLS